MTEGVFDPNALNAAEAQIVEATRQGEWARLSPDEAGQKPIVRAAFLRHLMLRLPLTKTDVPWFISPTGVRVSGAHMPEDLNLSDACGSEGNPLPALALEDCDFADRLCLDHAKIERLSFKGSRLRELSGHGLVVNGAVDISRLAAFEAEGQPVQCWVHLDGAEIRGQVDVRRAHFVAPPVRETRASDEFIDHALSLRDARIGQGFGGDYLTGDGGVNLDSSDIGGDVWLTGASLTARDGAALRVSTAQLRGSLFLDKGDERAFVAQGLVSLSRAKISGNLDCNGGQFLNRSEDGQASAIIAEAVEIGGSCLLRYGFKSEGCVWLLGAKISGNLACDGGQFLNRSEDGKANAITADAIEIGGACLLRDGFKSEGCVWLLGAKIAGNLACDGGQFLNRSEDGKANAIVAHGIEIGGACHLRSGFKSEGCVRLSGAKIASDLVFNGGQFLNRSEDGQANAIMAQAIEIGGACLMRDGFKSEGHISLRGSQVASQSDIDVTGENIVWDLRDASTGVLNDWLGGGWGGKGTTLMADGFTYHRLIVVDLKAHLKWLKTYFDPKSDRRYSPLPYVQLARALRASGHVEESRRVLRRQQSMDIKAQVIRPNWGWLWLGPPLMILLRALYGWMFGYGYSPSRATSTFILCILFGAGAVHLANGHGLMTLDMSPVATVAKGEDAALPSVATAKTVLPCRGNIQSTLYALDTFVPVIDLRQESKCEFGSVDEAYGEHWPVWHGRAWDVVPALRWGKALYAFVGALITALTILTFTGTLQRKDEES